MDLNQLRLLTTIYEVRSMTRAAQKLHLTQSAASHSLSKLRTHFNDELFVRTSYGMHPTPFLQTKIPQLTQGFLTIERSLQTEKRFDPSTDSRTFHIGACDYFEVHAMPALAKRFVDIAPNINISIDLNSEHVKMDRIEGGRLDLYIGIDELQQVPLRCKSYPWIKDKYVALVPQSSLLNSRLSMKELASQLQVHLPIISSGSDVIDNWLQDHNLHRPIQMIAQSYTAGGMICAQSGLLFCVPYRIAKVLVTMQPLKILELPKGAPKLKLSIFSHELYDHYDSTQWMLKQILNVT